MAKRFSRLPIPPGAGATSIAIPRFPAVPTVRFLGLTQAGPDWANAPHRHDEYEVHFVRRGSGTLIALGTRFPIAAGDIYLFRPSEEHGGFTDARDPAQVLYVGFSVPPALARAAFPGLGDRPIFLHQEVADLRQALRALAEALEPASPDAGGHRQIDEVPVGIIALALRVLAALLRPAERGVVAGGTPHEQTLAEAVLRHLDTDACAGPLPLKAVAAGLHVTPAHLGAVVRRVTGRTYPRLLAEVRARRAQALLDDDPALPVREVARRVGLSGGRALAKLLRRVTGAAPRRRGAR